MISDSENCKQENKYINVVSNSNLINGNKSLNSREGPDSSLEVDKKKKNRKSKGSDEVVTVIEDEMNLEDLMRQKVCNLGLAPKKYEFKYHYSVRLKILVKIL